MNASGTLPDAPPDKIWGDEVAGLFRCALDSAYARSEAQPWEPPSVETVARLLPQYHVEALIGRGGMGAVYRGVQMSLERPVAIKLLPTELAGNEEFFSRFQREAKTLARLHHPGIVSVHDFGQTEEGHCYFVMEYVNGTDLQRLIESQSLTPSQALELTVQVCEALHYAHAQDVIHRDIKPANVLMTQDGQAKLADFGLSRPLTVRPEGSTLATLVMGTPDYMAPEQWRGKADQRSDIYALGVMLYEMLTGVRPQGAFDLPSQKVQVDVRLDEVVVKAMRQEPERRYQKVSELGQDVNSIRTGAAPTPPAHEQGPAQGGSRRSFSLWRRHWPLGVGGSLALGAVVMVSMPKHTVAPRDIAERQSGNRSYASPRNSTPPGTTRGGAKVPVFTNSLGMQFVPVPGTNVQICIHETRNGDYARYAAEKPGLDEAWKRAYAYSLPVNRGDDYPVCHVNWLDAVFFCEWLSQREGRTYRLPTDREWSHAVGTAEREPSGPSPEELARLQLEVADWPRPAPGMPADGNFADETLAKVLPSHRGIPGYVDGYATSSPVMSYPPNRLGIHDLMGNQWEYVQDWFDEAKTVKAIRGNCHHDTYSSPSSRALRKIDMRHESAGFRVVLENPSSKENATPEWEVENDFVDLFASERRLQWKNQGDVVMQWGEEGIARLSRKGPGQGYPWYAARPFGDFVLRLDFRIRDIRGNSGVLLRSPALDTIRGLPDPQVYQVDLSNFPQGNQASGAIMFVQSPTSVPMRFGGWNHLEIQAEGQRYQVWLNGEKVNDFTGQRLTEGYLAFQMYRPEGVEFRRLRIRELRGK
ncbi:Serine/threonine protein kinase [Prosthecobacter debontii]|uniref:Serine/threonine protein kinase n=1 Tax=Prosthecobacter debontii TaxID=48467 RepID=A0A1T4Z3G8_9BACT|nr:protein kinase [Prosthecobacter debontii]SKB08111.1 Serine/threonine protein kinase [Prosthecobacter debontii]